MLSMIIPYKAENEFSSSPRSRNNLGFVTLWRSSQPKPGMFSKRCHVDEYLLQLMGNPEVPDFKQYYEIANGGYNSEIFNKTNLIVMDLRPKGAAWGNK